jgi:hypothetical protein
MKRYAWVLLLLFLVPAVNCTTINRVIYPATKTPTPTATPTLTPTPTGIFGITTPVEVDGVSLKFTGVQKESHWLVGSDDYTPTSSTDTFLVISADVLTVYTAHSTVAGWDVTLNGNVSWTFLQSHGDSSSIDSVQWVFIVDQNLSNFTINLPGGVDVPLDSLY